MKKQLRIVYQNTFPSSRRGFWSIVWLLTVVTASAQTVRYVKPGGTGDGSSWAQASADVQAMINASSANDQVWVAGGTYKPGGNANTDRSISFTMKSSVGLYGGFAGTEATINDRPASLTLGQPSSTTLSGDLGVIGTINDNSYHIISNTDVNNAAVLDGFVLKAAYPSGFSSPQNLGGGMYNVNSSPTVRNCFFASNQGDYQSNGGGFFGDGTSNSQLINCTFVDNSARFAGAISGAGSLTIINCSFSNNYGLVTGAVVVNSATISNCTFNNNSAESSGGAPASGGAAQVGSGSVITNCLFASNFARANGGALVLGNNVTVDRCTFRGNLVYSGGAGVADAYGGAIIGGGVNTVVSNCSFSNNRASARGTAYGGAVYGSNATYINCSFGNNLVDRVGGAFAGGSPRLTNCILWGNKIIINDSDNGIDSQITNATVTYTDTQDGTPGTGNLNADPLFVDAPGDNLRISACSPVIDKGDNSVSVGSIDLAGNSRRVRTIDQGAYEFQGSLLNTVGIVQQPNRSYSIPQGGSITVSVSTTGSVSGYQWYRNGVAITGNASATTATLTINNLSAADDGNYYVVVTGNCGSVTSNTFRLIVNTGMYTLKSGSWDDPSVWALNRVPVNSDPVRIKHLVTIPASYVAQARRVSFDTGQKLKLGSAARLKLNQ